MDNVEHARVSSIAGGGMGLMRSVCTVMMLALLVALGCGATPFGSGPGRTTGATGAGGSSAAGGAGGSTSAVGGGTGGTLALACTTPPKVSAENCGTPNLASGSFRVLWPYSNYRLLGDFAGFAYVIISPTPNPLDTFVCASSFGLNTQEKDTSPFALCGAGTVPADCTGNAVGGVGFNFNQPQWGSGSYENGYTQPTLPINQFEPVSSVTVTFVARLDSELRIQIAQDSPSGSIYYCRVITGMPSPVTLAANELRRHCWDHEDHRGDSGEVWDGTGAESIALIVPSQSSKPTQFEACIQNVELD
jgi:hypothetical protein